MKSRSLKEQAYSQGRKDEDKGMDTSEIMKPRNGFMHLGTLSKERKRWQHDESPELLRVD